LPAAGERVQVRQHSRQRNRYAATLRMRSAAPRLQRQLKAGWRWQWKTNSTLTTSKEGGRRGSSRHSTACGRVLRVAGDAWRVDAKLGRRPPAQLVGEAQCPLPRARRVSIVSSPSRSPPRWQPWRTLACRVTGQRATSRMQLEFTLKHRGASGATPIPPGRFHPVQPARRVTRE
jgi:hypothetical protein